MAGENKHYFILFLRLILIPFLVYLTTLLGALKQRNNKARECEKVPVDVLQLSGENGLRLMAQLTNNVGETGDCSKDFRDFIAITLKKKPKATKCSNHRGISRIASAAKLQRECLEEGLKGKLKMYLEKISSDL
jgi:hypothetical protein